MEACHDDGNASNNRLENLRWDTPTNNHADKQRHGTQSQGEKHYRARLTTVQVIEIRLRFKNGDNQKTIAKDFGIGRDHVSRIVHLKARKHG